MTLLGTVAALPWSRDVVTFRRDSLSLERYRCRDFSELADEIATVMHGHSDDLFVFPLPLASRVTKDLAQHYVTPPTRTFAGVTPEEAKRLGLEVVHLSAKGVS